MIDLRPFVTAGSGVFFNQTCAEPTPLVQALLDQVAEIGPVRAFVGLTLDRGLTEEPPAELQVVSYGGLGALRTLSRAGRLEVVPAHYSQLPGMFARHELPGDVGLIQVSEPDENGWCSLGLGVDYIADAVPHATVLIAEINAQMPATVGSDRIHLDRFAAVLHTDRPLITAPEAAASEVEREIGRHVAGLVEYGDTIQVGVGSLPGAVLDALSDHRDLGLHTGLVGDSVLRLVRAGVLTGARKEIDAGLLVTGAALGSSVLYETVPELPIEFRAASRTHDPAVLARLRTLTAINSAIEVDLVGNVGAERIGGRWVGAIGGQVDFSRAASRTGARSIIALRSTAGARSTLVPALSQGAPTTGADDIDHVVTEFGVATLRGATAQQRRSRLLAVAHPDHREQLAAATHGLAVG